MAVGFRFNCANVFGCVILKKTWLAGREQAPAVAGNGRPTAGKHPALT